MRIATLRTLKDRLEADARLAEWAFRYEQASPQIVIGYKAVRTADEWPFVALVPLRETRQVGKSPRTRELSAVVVTGIRLASDPESDAATGLEMADALAETVVTVLTESPILRIGSLILALSQVELTDVLAKHPSYEFEQLLTWTS